MKPIPYRVTKAHVALASFLLCSVAVYGQNDSLLMILDTARNRTTLLTTLDALGKNSLRSNTKNAINYYEEYARVAGDEITKQAYAYNQIGVAWYFAEDIKQSTEYYFKALELLPNQEDHALLSRIYNNIGWNLQVQKELDPAIEYFKKAEAAATLIQNKSFIAFILNNLGVAYKNKGEYAEALAMYKKAYTINQELEILSGQISNLNNISILYIQLKDFDQSAQHLEMVKPLIYKARDTTEMVNYLHTTGELLLKLELNTQALDTVKRGLELAKKIGFVNQFSELEFLRYQAYQALGDYQQALESYKVFAVLNDSIYKTGQAEFVKELNLKYNVTQKEKDLQIAQNQNLEQRMYLMLISGGLALAVIALFFIVRNYQLKRRKNKVLNALNKKIVAQSEELRLANEAIKMINENLEGKILERTQTLKIHNDKLVKYARMNAHDVRGPLARVLGLVQLLDITEPTEKERCIALIKQSAKELDEVIHAMNKTLEEEDFE